MKQFKFFDFWIQVILASGSLLLAAFYDKIWYIYAYFLVGGWQVLSCLIHLANKSNFIPDNSRSSYAKIVALIAILSVLLIPIWFLMGYVLLFIAPLLAIWYAVICYGENQLLKKRALIHLK